MDTYIVVGAGILGAATAYHLAKEGAKVTVVDRNDPGQATDAAAGIICPWLSQRRNKAWYQLAKNGARYYPTLIKELEEAGEKETGYAKVGAISLHSNEKKLEKMMERAMKRREDAPEIGEITLLSPAKTQALFPPLSNEYGSVHVSGGARVNGRALREALINGAKKHGVTFINGNGMLVNHGNQVIGVSVNGMMLEAKKVIVTAGTWAKEFLKPLGVTLSISPQKGQIIHLEISHKDTSNWPVVIPPNDQYLLSFENGRIVIGATHENEAGLDIRVTAGGLHEIFTKALEVAPGLRDSTFLETRVGYRPFSPGFLPIIGNLPKFEGIILANGLGASGLTIGPYLGSELAKLALGRPGELEIGDYDVAGAIQD